MRFENELKRKSIHFFCGLCIPLGYYFFPEGHLNTGRLILLIITIGSWFVDVFRHYIPPLQNIFLKLFSVMLRPHEIQKISGASYLLLASTISIYLYPHDIAVMVLLFLVIGDTAAALIGKQYGKTPLWGKSLEGSFACFLVCFIIALMVTNFSVELCFFAAFIATLSELAPLPIDDNFRIPIISGLLVWAISGL